jgi:hypothetical protein
MTPEFDEYVCMSWNMTKWSESTQHSETSGIRFSVSYLNLHEIEGSQELVFHILHLHHRH